MKDLIIIVGLPLAFLLYTKLVFVDNTDKITFKSFGVGTLALFGYFTILISLYDIL